eukprot:562920-Pyramimonas_sp.AAC.1
MQGGSFSKCVSGNIPAHIHCRRSQQLQAWRAAPFQSVALALAPHTLVAEFAIASRMDGGSFPTFGSRVGAAHA